MSGSGNLQNEVLKISKEQRIDSNIIITGWVNDVEKYISAFDIALLPSKWEGFGLAIVEYMACKKPIITTKVGGISDILNLNEAFFVEKGDYIEIASKVKYIVENRSSVEKMIENNFTKCKKRFTIEKEVLKTEKLVTNIMNK